MKKLFTVFTSLITFLLITSCTSVFEPNTKKIEISFNHARETASREESSELMPVTVYAKGTKSGTHSASGFVTYKIIPSDSTGKKEIYGTVQIPGDFIIGEQADFQAEIEEPTNYITNRVTATISEDLTVILSLFELPGVQYKINTAKEISNAAATFTIANNSSNNGIYSLNDFFNSVSAEDVEIKGLDKHFSKSVVLKLKEDITINTTIKINKNNNYHIDKYIVDLNGHKITFSTESADRQDSENTIYNFNLSEDVNLLLYNGSISTGSSQNPAWTIFNATKGTTSFEKLNINKCNARLFTNFDTGTVRFDSCNFTDCILENNTDGPKSFIAIYNGGTISIYNSNFLNCNANSKSLIRVKGSLCFINSTVNSDYSKNTGANSSTIDLMPYSTGVIVNSTFNEKSNTIKPLCLLKYTNDNSENNQATCKSDKLPAYSVGETSTEN